jgi:hypothetical protein
MISGNNEFLCPAYSAPISIASQRTGEEMIQEHPWLTVESKIAQQIKNGNGKLLLPERPSLKYRNPLITP